MTSPLSGHRIIVTRPQHQAQGLVAKLHALGGETELLPVLAINPIAPSQLQSGSADRREALAIEECLSDPDRYAKAIFISTNAVRNGFTWIRYLWQVIPSQLQCFGIGKSTVQALVDEGVDAKTSGLGMNSESLLELPELQHIEGQNIVIFRGIGGREFLAEQLRKRGATVDYCELYRRDVADLDQGCIAKALRGAPSCVILNSNDTLAALLQLADRDEVTEHIKQLPVIVPSERVANEARNAGFPAVYCAKNASDEAIVECICEIH